MRGLARMPLPARQRGAVLMIVLALVGVLFIYAVVSGLNRSAAELTQARAQKTANSLAQAKEALIAYAATYKDTHDDPGSSSYTVPGYLPCPDFGPPAVEGQAAGAGSCGSSLVSVMGRLPWKTLGLDALKDGSGECLWYAVSGTYKNTPNGVSGSTTTSNMMNWDTNGQFDVKDASNTIYLTGLTADTNAVAVIFAPGAALSGQNRTLVAGTAACGGNFNSVPAAAAYLETSNGINNSVVSGSASAQSTFIAGTSSSTFNDQLVYITRADIWNAIKRRSDFNDNLRALTRRAAECTAMYGTQNNAGTNDKRLPWASNVSLSTTSVPTYAVNASYNDASGAMSGRLPFKVNTADTTTNNSLSSSISDYGTSSAYIFTNSSYCSYRPEEKIWYENWKDQLFYALANNYDPGTSSSTQSCPTCLKINGSGNFAAVVIFAGDKLTNVAGQVTQPRSLAANTDKGLISNYLEGRNSSNHPNSGGNGNYQAAATSSTFNDIVYAIDTNLRVQCYSPTSNSMVLAPAADPAPLSPPGPPPHFPLGGAIPPVTPYAACP